MQVILDRPWHLAALFVAGAALGYAFGAGSILIAGIGALAVGALIVGTVRRD